MHRRRHAPPSFAHESARDCCAVAGSQRRLLRGCGFRSHNRQPRNTRRTGTTTAQHSADSLAGVTSTNWPEGFEQMGQGPLADTMGITVDFDGTAVTGRMPVEGNTQPYGILHGGATAVLVESVGVDRGGPVVARQVPGGDRGGGDPSPFGVAWLCDRPHRGAAGRADAGFLPGAGVRRRGTPDSNRPDHLPAARRNPLTGANRPLPPASTRNGGRPPILRRIAAVLATRRFR